MTWAQAIEAVDNFQSTSHDYWQAGVQKHGDSGLFQSLVKIIVHRSGDAMISFCHTLEILNNPSVARAAVYDVAKILNYSMGLLAAARLSESAIICCMSELTVEPNELEIAGVDALFEGLLTMVGKLPAAHHEYMMYDEWNKSEQPLVDAIVGICYYARMALLDILANNATFEFFSPDWLSKDRPVILNLDFELFYAGDGKWN